MLSPAKVLCLSPWVSLCEGWRVLGRGTQSLQARLPPSCAKHSTLLPVSTAGAHPIQHGFTPIWGHHKDPIPREGHIYRPPPIEISQHTGGGRPKSTPSLAPPIPFTPTRAGNNFLEGNSYQVQGAWEGSGLG